MERVLIKGAGDLATGIGCRLHRCGFSVAMTEIAVPTTVRRTVAFSRAVYEGSALVEDVEGVLCRNTGDIDRVVNQDKVAVIVDESCETVRSWKPDIVVDAILAKVNLGTEITDADIVIGVGPGFTAGSAFPNTGVPGMIGGYDKERIIRAASDGIFTGAVEIGTLVEKGDVVGSSGGTPIYAEVGGVVRGLLQDGVAVTKGMKSGDIDPRGVTEHCWTISDKATAIGGGVLEGIFHIKKNRRVK